MTTGYNKLLLFAGLFLVMTLLFAGNSMAAEFAIILKGGTVQLADESQRHDGEIRNFDESSSRTFALAWEIRNARNVGLGMEYITFEHDFTTPSAPAADGFTRSQIYLFSARKYFDMGKMVVPFGGIGLGWGYTRYDDGFSRVDRDWNLALQLSLGLEIQFADEFGIYLEGKGLASDTDGDRANEFDFSGPSLMAGVSFIF